jgi:hypothetical protein
MAIHGVASHDFTMQEVQDSYLSRESDGNCLLGHKRCDFGGNDGDRHNNRFQGKHHYLAKTPQVHEASSKTEENAKRSYLAR